MANKLSTICNTGLSGMVHAGLVGTMTIQYGNWRASSAYGLAGNSPYSDMELPATITCDDGAVIKDVFSTVEGAEFWADKYNRNPESRPIARS